ncbi:MAG: hypothetical protein KUG62_08015 [Rhodobacteraceae bacterium]|nr:hypothetical protein [Paracoccaceae bacterium]
MIRLFAVLCSLVFLVGCGGSGVLDQPPPPLGDFKLGHNIVVTSKMQKGPISREASEEEWKEVLTGAIGDRFGRYDGEGLYHFGISVEGYMLAPKGVPLLYSPKSALILNVTVWQDSKARKLNESPYQMTIFESTDEESVILGSGWGRDKDEQLVGLSFNATLALEKWLVQQHEDLGWFTPDAKVAPKGYFKTETVTDGRDN